VIEEFLPGEEVSLLAFTDGKICLPLLPVQDHKRIGEGDTGPNTGGMGAYTPADHLVTPPIMERIQHRILDPTLVALQQRGIAYVGILYAGLMISPAGDPYVVEFNCRFGDPETQVLLPLLKTPLDQVMLACATGRLAQIQLEWQPGHAACVVMACRGYPDHYERGNRISGLDQAAATGALVFHAGTRSAGAGSPHECVTDGGRVLCITGRGESLSLALEQAYAAVRSIHFDGAYYRSDIGFKALKKEAAGS
jgi:phosphoribosylamine--glycine ligase